MFDAGSMLLGSIITGVTFIAYHSYLEWKGSRGQQEEFDNDTIETHAKTKWCINEIVRDGLRGLEDERMFRLAKQLYHDNFMLNRLLPFGGLDKIDLTELRNLIDKKESL